MKICAEICICGLPGLLQLLSHCSLLLGLVDDDTDQHNDAHEKHAY
jgi:hypothetical protein